MLLRSAHTRQLLSFKAGIRYLTTSTSSEKFPRIPVLKNLSLNLFRHEYFRPGIPALFPQGHFKDIPAISKWFRNPQDLSEGQIELNPSYLKPYGDIIIPMELTETHGASKDISFARLSAPLLMFLHGSAAQSLGGINASPSNSNLYIAQCPLSDLPAEMQADLPTPEAVQNVGKGDVYASSIWLGRAPTYTPLHKDPNPNLFVQLAGRKVVRLINPDDGESLYRDVRRRIGEESGGGSFRGEEMMAGKEREVLKEAVWGSRQNSRGPDFLEGELGPGDGVFIPKGWWHSIKSVGEGMIGSVCSYLSSVS